MAAFAAVCAWPGWAAADGAFPDSDQVLLPPAHPDQILLSTNFGLIVTDDGGATWEWTCETPLIAMGRFFQLGVSGGPAVRIVASSLWGVVYSDDQSCRWDGASGDVADVTVTDVFVDRADPDRVFALGADATTEGAYVSRDGGASFGPAIFTAPPGERLLGIESAASDPLTIYIAVETGADHPHLARTRDGGATWQTSDLTAALGPGLVRIVAVGGSDATAAADTIFLRVSTATQDRLAVSIDGGLHWAIPLAVNGSLTAFLRRADGTLLVGGVTNDGGAFGARSLDGGVTFGAWPGVKPPRLRALAERAGLLYAAADNFADGFAVGVSADQGLTWRPLLTYDRVARIRPCVSSLCLNDCHNQAAAGLWPSSMCDGAGGGGGAGAGVPPGAGGAGVTGPARVPAGCACSEAQRAGGRGSGRVGFAFVVVFDLVMAVAIIALAHRRRRR